MWITNLTTCLKISLLLLVTLCSTAAGKTIYVDDDAIGANNGTSWVDAYVYLQDALFDANDSDRPVEIRVAEGVYKPDQGANQTPGDREASFHLINGVTLKGGYAGYVEPDPNANDRDRYKTVLSGDLNSDDPSGYHWRRVVHGIVYVGEDAAKRALVPTAPISEDWKSITVFDDSVWLSGTGGVGYERTAGYEALISLDVVDEMYNQNSTCYIRIPFTVNANDWIDPNFLTLNIRYDDAFIAYINGIEVARRNFTGTPKWNSHASVANPDNSAVEFEHIEIFNDISVLREGNNLLAIHGMNVSATSSDFLISVELLTGQPEEYEDYIEEIEVDPHSLLTDPNRSENSYHVLTASGTGRTATLDGFTICGGNANIHAAWPSFTAYGGGIYNGGGSPTLLNCNFTHNSALRYGGGGGMFNRTNSNPTLTNCAFSGNSAGYGGGMYNQYDSNPTLTNCAFSGNSAGGGGGMYNQYDSNPNLTNCTFNGNSAENGGGMCNLFSSNPTLTNCAFSGNSAGDGGGMYNQYGSNPTLTNCTFSGNLAEQMGGGMNNRTNSNPTLTNCTFAQNSSENGNALACDSYGFPNNVELINCILWNGGNEIWNNDGSTIMITYSNIEGGFPGEGNIDADPLFAVLGYYDDNGTPEDVNDDYWVDGDYHLKSQAGRFDPNTETWIVDDVTSPCIDAGDPNNPVAFEPFPNGDIINMGAYGGTAEASKSPSGLHAKYGGGTGEPNDPYLIYTTEHMNTIGADANEWDKHFKLMADIDLSQYTETDFNIIGYFESHTGILEGLNKPFTGIFDGNGKTISNFNYTSADKGIYFAIFGYVHGEDAHIKDLGLINPNIDLGTGGGVGSLVGYLVSGTVSNCYCKGGSVSGGWALGGLVGINSFGTITDCYSTSSVSTENGGAGGLVGSNDGTIRRCYSTGTVSAEEGRAGGLAGSNGVGIISGCYSTGHVIGEGWVGGLAGSNGGTIKNCYSTGRVSGDNWVGGLVGYNAGTIANCHATGEVEGIETVGGLVGLHDHGIIVNCYSTGRVTGESEIGGLAGFSAGGIVASFWDIQTSGQQESAGGTGKTTAEMQTAATFLTWGCGNEGIWTMDDGNDYPRLWWENKPGEIIKPISLSDFLLGTGTVDDPYLIYTPEELNMIGYFTCEWDKHFALMADIDLSAYVGTAFNIIGAYDMPFTGVFDGHGHTVSYFSHSSAHTCRVGLFGYVSDPNAEIKNIQLLNPNISVEGGKYAVQGEYIGSLVGYLGDGVVTNCYASSGRVLGNSHIGGLVGQNDNGTIRNCYSTVSVSGDYFVGGLVGVNRNGSIATSNSTGTVTGNGGINGGVGGLVGRNYDTITNCYATGSVTGDEYVGGLVGYNITGAVTTSYSTGAVIGNEDVGGLVGRNRKGSISTSFWDIETSGLTNMCGSQSDDATGCDDSYGKTTAEMQTASTFLEASWNFVDETANGTEDIWWILEGRDYPRLWWETE